ncbi:hypothetical protein TWF696_005624 [Orbilia brochopaga]|uniref:CST complex subunit Stn1 N-terminal domain-containing protein n=1 Tax=Orbilia brochopaga TaxID=3140254 RepID=A0AAV9V1A2_9PEZI
MNDCSFRPLTNYFLSLRIRLPCWLSWAASAMDPLPAPRRRKINRSETYTRWVKLLLCDIAASLRCIPEYAPESTFFINEHPIRWVHVVGTIICINEQEKRIIYTIDDGSGQTMDAVVHRADAAKMKGVPKLHSVVKAKGQLELVYGAFQMKVILLQTGLTLEDQAQFWVEAAETHEKLRKQQQQQHQTKKKGGDGSPVKHKHVKKPQQQLKKRPRRDSQKAS